MRAAILGFASGIWWLQRQAELPSGWTLAALGAAALAGVAFGLHRSTALRLAPAAMRVALAAAVGFAWAGLAAQVRLADSLDPALEGRDVELRGVVATLPQPVERGVRFQFDVEDSAQTGVPRRLLLAWYNGLSPEEYQEVAPLRAGERWRLTVRLRRPHGLSNPHGFDYEAWLLERGIRATGYVRPGGSSRVDGLVLRPSYLLERLRERLRERFWDALPEARYAGVLIALAIGEQRAIDAKEWDLFARTGVTHLMSISGLHVTMVAGMLAWAVFALWRRCERLALWLPAQKAAAVGGFLAALAYCLLSGFAVPAQRTLYMVGVVAFALALDRAGAPSRVLACALALVLALDPWAVLEAGFWLSFAAVALIFYITVARPGSRGWLRQWAAVQWAMTVGLAPLTLVLFQQVSLVGPLANALAIPLVSFVVTPLALAGTVLPFDLPLQLAHFLLEAMVPLLQALADLDFALWRQHAPVAWTVALALLGGLWLLAPSGMPGRALGAVLMLPLFSVAPPATREHSARITFLDVGQGMAVVVRTRDHALLYDAGPAWGPEPESGLDAGARVIVPFLRAAGVQRLDAMVISHDDSDHSGGAASVLGSLATGSLVSSLGPEHPLQRMARWRSACLAGTQWSWDGVRFRFLHPARADYDNPWTALNDRSCVLKIEARGGAALLAGDIGRLAEGALLARDPEALQADVLLVPHHGSSTSSSAGFVRAVSPRVAVFSVGYRNRFGHPRGDVLERYRSEGSAIVRADEAGAIAAHIGEDGVFVSTHRAAERRYWHGA